MACWVPAGGQSLSAAATGAKRAQRSANRREGCVCASSECLSSLFHRNVAGGTLRCQREAHGCARVAPKSTQQRGRRCATKGRSLPKAAQQGSCSMAAGDSALCLLKLHCLAWHLYGFLANKVGGKEASRGFGGKRPKLQVAPAPSSGWSELGPADPVPPLLPPGPAGGQFS